MSSKVHNETTASGAKKARAKKTSPEFALFNRELSWLEFNRRVLEEALDKSQPLLERLKFLAIFSTNLDEFFMIRVSGLQEEVEAQITTPSPDGMIPAEQLRAIAECLRPMVAEQTRCLREEILPELARQGIELISYRALSKAERAAADAYFKDTVFPVLTPQAVDPSHPFPYISNLSLNLCLSVTSPESADEPTETRFARIKIPPTVPRLVPVGDSSARFTWLDELIAANLDDLFPGMQTGKAQIFRVTRDADIEIREDEAGDLMRAMEQNLRRRRFGNAVRLEVAASMPPETVAKLTEELELEEVDVYQIPEPLHIPDLMTLYALDLPALKDPPANPKLPARLRQSKNIFAAIRERDILVHHPYTSYSAVTNFIRTAAHDPDVLAIKMCLYRTGKDSPIVKALMDASGNGKQVAALVELKARFDEQNNIAWAKRLEREGVHVVYGVQGLKTHCKVTLVVRRETDGLRRYVHLATGNYNPLTSKIYTDLGLFTADPEIGADAAHLFNYLTGFSRYTEFCQLLVAPVNLRERMKQLIERERAHQAAGRSAHIIAKINSLTDTEIIRALYAASQAGVKIDLIVRGICMLQPGVKGLSETITVRSIVGRYLEHSRIYYFANGGDDDVYIGSADWMKRNLSNRVEVVVPVGAPALKKYLRAEVLDAYLRDNVKARRLQSDGTYQRAQPANNEKSFSAQDYFTIHQ